MSSSLDMKNIDPCIDVHNLNKMNIKTGCCIYPKNYDYQSSQNIAETRHEEIAEQMLDTTKTEIIDQQFVCRLCGRTGTAYVPIFGNDNLSVAEKICRCLPIVVLSTDDLPSHVCPHCLHNLNISYRLIVTSIKVDCHLRQQLIESQQHSSSSVDENSAPDTEELQISTTYNALDACTDRLNSSTIYGPMECDMCGVVFTDMDEFDEHVETKHLLAWRCSLCDKSFETSETLVAHKQADHAGNVLICTSCIDEERLAHGLSSLAEMQNSRKCVKRARTKTLRKRIKGNSGQKSAEEIDNNGKNDNKEKKSDTRWLAMCDICKIAFGIDELLTAHRRIHQPKMLRCYMCQTDATSIYDLFLHKREVHNVYRRVQLKFVCDTCGKFFSNNWQWLNHQQKANCKKKSSSHACKYCGSNFSTNYKLTRHLRKHKDEMLKDPSVIVYRCVACPKVFVDKEFYQKHRNVHDPECRDNLKCSLCNRSFRDKRRLREHQQSIHEGIKPHPCDVCGKTFYRLSNMRVHQRKHFSQKCDHCGEAFDKLRLLANHMKDVHKLEPKFNLPPKKPYTSGSFVCRYCGKKLAAYQSLLDHEHIHTGEKPYPCKICDKTFRSYTARWAHAQRHEKGTYICEHCGKTFCYKNNLTTHMQVHRPVENRKHRCSKCSKLFLRKAHLNVHMRIHDGVRPYTCDICHFSFTQLGDMRRHRARHATGELRLRKPRTKLKSIPPTTNDETS